MQSTDISNDRQDLRERYIASLDALDEANDRLVAVLAEARDARDIARKFLATGRPLKDIEEVIEPRPIRSSVADALANLERTRHETQRLLFTLLQDEGQTLADIGRTYGISRQLVSRLVNEPDPLHLS